MPAMTMPFAVKDAWALDVLKPGARVQATLVVTGDRAWIQDLVITGPEKAGAPLAPTAFNQPRTGEAVKRMAMFFGFRYWPESGQLVHSLSTAVIRPDGRLDRLYQGNDWKPEQILSDLRALL
jgi:hypothetical protein